MGLPTSISRRTVLSGTAGVLAGFGLLSEIPSHNGYQSHETAQAQSASTKSNWPQYKADAGHSARVDEGTGPIGDIENAWMGDHLDSHGSDGVAVIGQTVYVGGKKLLALDGTNGQEHWAFEPELPERVDGSNSPSPNVGQPVVMDDTVYASVGFAPYEDLEGEIVKYKTALIAVDARTGERRWRFDADGETDAPYQTVTAAADSLVTGIPDGDANLLTVFSTDGEKRWQQRFDGDLVRFPVTDGRVYVPTTNGVTAWDVATGKEIWSALPNVRFDPAATPMVDNGTLFVAEEGEPGITLIALDAATGEENWRTDYTPGISAPQMVIGTADETGVYIEVEGIDSTVIALNRADGSERWRTTIERPEREYSSARGFALVGGVLYWGAAAIDPSNGETIWDHQMNVSDIDYWTLGAVAGGRVYLFGGYTAETLAVLTGTTKPSTETTTQTSTNTEATQTGTTTSSPETAETAPATKAATTTSTAAETTTTDGPGFGVLPAVAGGGLFAWRSLTNR